MKILFKFLTITLFLFSNYLYSQDGHFDSAYVILNLNDSGSNTWYDLGASTGNTDFDGADLGIFDLGSDDLKLIGTQHNMSKCASCNITGSTMYYRIYSYGSASGGYSGVSTSWNENGWDGCSTQRWQNLSLTTNLLNGLSGIRTLPTERNHGHIAVRAFPDQYRCSKGHINQGPRIWHENNSWRGNRQRNGG